MEYNEVASSILSARTMAELLDLWDMTEKREFSQGVADVRGWIMDELENRDSDAFWKWIDDYTGSPRDYFCTE